MEAHERLRLLTRRASDEVVAKSEAHLRAYIDAGLIDEAHREQLADAAAEMRSHGTMSGTLERTWTGLLERVRDPALARRLVELDPFVARGACSGGEVSAATFAFRDGSFLVLVDHGLMTLTWLAAALVAVGANEETAARAVRLALARPATGNTAGPTPSLRMSSRQIAEAGVLVHEMDLFLLAHELAHILLRHVDADTRPMAAIGDSAALAGKHAEQSFTRTS